MSVNEYKFLYPVKYLRSRYALGVFNKVNFFFYFIKQIRFAQNPARDAEAI